MSYQPRWVAYATSTGSTPDAAWLRDGNGASYFAWIDQRLAEYSNERGITRRDGLTQTDFTAWLEAYAAKAVQS